MSDDKAFIEAELHLAGVRAGMHDDRDLLKLLDTSSVKVGANGKVEIPPDFFAKAKQTKPHLFGRSRPHLVSGSVRELPRDQYEAAQKAYLADVRRR